MNRLLLLLLLYVIYQVYSNENTIINDNNNNNNENKDDNDDIWSPFIELYDANNIVDSYNLIKNLKFKRYWDISKNKFRYGVIGHDLIVTVPDAVIYTDMVMKNLAVIKDVPVVDINYLLSHAINVMKDISLNRYSILENNINNMSKAQETIMNKLLPLKEKVYHNDYISTNNLQSLIQIMILKHEKLDLQIQSEKKKTLLNIENMKYKKERRRILYSDFDARIANLTEQSQHNIDLINIEKNNKLQEITIEQALKDTDVNKQLFENEIDLEVERMKSDELSSLDIIKFRYLEESRIERENEVVNTRIMSAKDEYNRKGLDAVIVTVVDELSLQIFTAMQDTNILFLWVSRLFMSIISLAVVYEIFTSLGNISTYFSKNSVLRKFIPKRSSTTATFENLILENDTLESFESFLDHIKAALSAKGSLPNLLITGSTGVGKTISAMNIAMSSGLPYVSICEADLETMGSKAALYLRDLFMTKLKLLIVIDGADMLLNDRNYSTGENPLLRNCFHIILDAIRSGSSNICLIITTQKSINQIDGAILDRIDSVVELKLPLHPKRLEFTLTKIDEHLSTLLEPRALEIVSTLMPKDDNGVWKNRGQTPLYKSLLSSLEKKVGSTKKSGYEPETDRPSTDDDLNSSPNNRNRLSKSGTDFGFHVVKCIVELINVSEGWSYREIEKFLLCLRAEALGSSSCLVSQNEWMRELKRRRIHSPRNPI